MSKLFNRSLYGLCLVPVIVLAGGSNTPNVQDPGLSEKALEQSLPDFQPENQVSEDVFESGADQTPSGANQGPSFFIKRIKVEGNTLLADESIAAVTDMGGGRDVTLTELNGIAQKITVLYLQEGYLFVRAYLPQQEIGDDATVTINILEGFVEKISVVGNTRHNEADIIASLDDIMDISNATESQLEQSLLILNDVQGIEARAVMEAGQQTGATHMVVNVEESRPYQVSFNADNYGSVFTGQKRFGLSGLYSSLFRFGDEISVRALGTNGEQNYLSASYKLPIKGLQTWLEASYVYADQQLGANLVALQAKGDTNIATLKASHIWRKTRNQEIVFEGGIKARFYKNEQLGVVTSDDSIGNVFVGVNGYFNDRFRARTYYDVELQAGLTESDRNDALNSRLNGRGNAIIGSFNLTRYQAAIWMDSYFILKAAGQLADRRVLSPDLYASGGIGTVRGYPLAEISGDNAYLVSSEYVLPFPSKLNLIDGWPSLKDSVSLFAFIDHSTVFANDRVTGEQNQSLTGAGGGVRINVDVPGEHGPSISFSASYGKPVLGSQAPSDGNNGILYLGGQISY